MRKALPKDQNAAGDPQPRDPVAEGATSDRTRRRLLRKPASRMPRPPHWSMALLLMLSLHVFWFVWLLPGAASHRRLPPHGPNLTMTAYPPAGAGGEGRPDDARVIWSPVLLSLPSPLGFSGSIRSGQIRMTPALAAPAPKLHYLERSATPGVAARAPAIPPLTDLARQSMGTLELAAPAAAPRDQAAPPPENDLHVEFTPPLSHGDFADIEWPGSVSAGALAPWGMVVWMEFGENGLPRSVLVEEPAPNPGLNQTMLRGLRRWMLKPGVGPVSGRVTIRYVRQQVPGDATESDFRP